MNSINNRLGSIRPSQIITTFGSGSIYDTLDDSVMVLGIDFWNNKHYNEIKDERLLNHLRKKFRKLTSFRVPVSVGNQGNISCVTFPSYGECYRCHKLTTRNGRNGQFGCPDCKVLTHPARLIVACANGHVDDFPWFEWVDHKKDKNCDDSKLYLKKIPYFETVSLAGLEVHCENCKSSRSLGKALSHDGISSIIGRCNGRRPWLNDTDSNECTTDARGLLKGASNVYFSSTIRALCIPPYTDKTYEIIRQHDKTLLALVEEEDSLELLEGLIRKFFPEPDYNQKEVMEKLRHFNDLTSGNVEMDIEKDEWKVLNSSQEHNYDDYKTVISTSSRYDDLIDKIVIVKRLKEIMVLRGFTRINPPDPEEKYFYKVSPISSGDITWLPAVENRGEGIFFSINSSMLNEWENKVAVQNRANQVFTEHKNIRQQKNLSTTIDYLPRFLLLHTISHLLIRHISNEAGYSTSSIRERIYASEDMAGILLYTSSPSSDGSLGGLVKLGKSPYFDLYIQKAIESAKICSSDPLCSDHRPQVTHRDNGSACHACLFLPETSCINMNILLDRAVIASTLSNYGIGFFSND